MKLSSEDHLSYQIEWNLNDCIQNGIVNKLQDESSEIIIDPQPQRGAQPLSTGVPRFFKLHFVCWRNQTKPGIQSKSHSICII